MRKCIFDIIGATNNNKYSKVYDVVMIVTIVFSLIPLMFKQETLAFNIIEKATVTIFIIDYILRWITADYFFENRSLKSYLKYPFTIMAIIDLISILPSICALNQGVKLLRIFRLIRAMKVLRVFKAMRYSKNFQMIVSVISKTKDSLCAVVILAIGYILISALVMFNIEPETFETLFDAVYWATISLTTVGYGDIYAVSTLGKIITMISSVLGIAIVALPAGIITAGYMDELKKED